MNELHKRFVAELVRRQLECGGWAALVGNSQPAIEATCFGLFALAGSSQEQQDRAERFLLANQNRDGSWPMFAGDDGDGVCTTAMAVMALRDVAAAIPARLAAYHWLLNCAGRESSWLWKWKFRTFDRHVSFDPDKFGWPWVPETVSWVVPTALAILALNQLPCACGGLELVPARTERGTKMLLDRACPGGGWNAGNGVVYGSALASHGDDTAIALLALSNQPHDPVVRSALALLEALAAQVIAPWTLSWAILALAAHHRPVEPLISALASLPDLAETEDNSTLALVCLALDHQRSLSAFGVAV